MQSNIVLQSLNSIGATSGTKDKVTKLQVMLSNDGEGLAEKTFRLALDPFITFGVTLKSIEYPESFGSGVFREQTHDVLAKLASRELSGNAAKAAIKQELAYLCEESAELFVRILTKNLKCKISAKTFNTVVEDPIFLFNVQLSEKYADHFESLDWDRGVYAEVKEDGVRGVSLHHKDYHFVSRKGLPLQSDADLRSAMKQMGDLWASEYGMEEPLNFDVEMCELSDSFYETSGNSRRKGGSKTMGVVVLDALTDSELSQGSVLRYSLRRLVLESFFEEFKDQLSPRIRLVKSFQVNSDDEVVRLFNYVRGDDDAWPTLLDLGPGRRKKEGLIVKPAESHWEPKRSKGWLKLKDWLDVDLVITRVEFGEAGKALANQVASLIADYTNTKGEVVEVRISSGLTDALRQQWTVDPSLIVGQLVEVRAHEETKDGSLRHARFIRIRDDKPLEDGQGC